MEIAALTLLLGVLCYAFYDSNIRGYEEDIDLSSDLLTMAEIKDKQDTAAVEQELTEGMNLGDVEQMKLLIAKEVKETQVETKLDSMNSYERRIIHSTLSDNKYVYTESVGEEPNRCVVVKPKGN